MNILYNKYVSLFSSMYNIYKSLHLPLMLFSAYFCEELTIFSVYLFFPGRDGRACFEWYSMYYAK